APPRFFGTTGWPHISESFCATMRPTMSVELPGVNEMMTCTGLLGYCASACAANASNAAPNTVLLNLMPASWLWIFCFGPVVGPGFRTRQRLSGFVARRHRRRRSREHLVVIDVEQPQPALLAEGEADHAAELDQLGLAEMPVHALPEGVVGVEMPRDRLGVGERRFLPVG